MREKSESEGERNLGHPCKEERRNRGGWAGGGKGMEDGQARKRE